MNRLLLLSTCAPLVFLPIQAQKYTSAISPNCVVPSFIDGQDRFTNGCGERVVVTVVFNHLTNGAYGMHLEDGQWGSTGHSRQRTVELGGASVHVCPEGAHAVDAGGRSVYRVPVSNYRCRIVGPDFNPETAESSSDLVTGSDATASGPNGVGGVQAKSASSVSLEQQAVAKLGATATKPVSQADLEHEALVALEAAQKVMAEAQARMDAINRGEHVGMGENPALTIFPVPADQVVAATSDEATPETVSAESVPEAVPDQIQNALQQQLAAIRQQAATVGQRGAASAPAPSGTPSSVCTADYSKHEVCRAK